ncbi:dihydropyrimidinase [Psychrobacillus sp. INOP01]|uniref:dihydropyrimidinase n=1 Tax=Psychrobacillus sp. INOP01 TaxID=2829187 RepID=UPI001BAAF13A|nr:dihydropyrimidinase [Psychrobacillus sp. INOP01]QUG40618.1 dihydropyrimidinase [Psychrobacillus sp. INOP01]
MSILIKSGTIVNSSSSYVGDIEIDKGKIIAIGLELPTKKGMTVIDATNKYVIPGIIDVHTHVDHFGGKQKTEDNFFEGTKSAAFGGTTTIIDFAIQAGNEDTESAIARRKSEAKNLACIDYSLHAHLKETSSGSDPKLKIQSIIEEGIPTFKIFTTYRDAGFMIDDYNCLEYMKILSENNGLLMVHAENDAICESITNKLIETDTASVINYPKSRPIIAEVEAISKIILFAKKTDVSVYFVHVTTEEGLKLIENAQKSGMKIFAETCTHYLVLNEEVYKRDDGYKFIMAPPLRKENDIDYLWEGIRNRSISVVSSDHCAYSSDKKVKGEHNFTEVSPGLQGIEMLLPLVYSEGVCKNRITINDLVRILCENPAEIFGLKNTKGKISLGYDADLVIINPSLEWEMTDTNHNMMTDFNPYSGYKVKGRPEYVLSNGKMIVDNFEFKGEKGQGRFIKRYLH